MVFLILESLGSTELLFILVMALVFFGPRKLPQLSRSFGKSLADFRRASEDFKRTWDREVSLEESNSAQPGVSRAVLPEENSMLDLEEPGYPLQPPTIEAVAPERVIARESNESDSLHSVHGTDLDKVASAEPLRKRDWL